MFANYLNIALQTIRKQPIFAAIKILSLTLGLACSILVLLHVQFVQSTNKHIDNWQNTYRLVTHMMVRETQTPYRTSATADPYIRSLRQDYADQIEHIALIRGGDGLFSQGNQATQNNFHWAEPDTVYLFDLEFLAGDPASALTAPNTMVLTESTARRYFGNESALGKVLRYNNQVDIQVTGVVRDVPENATMQFEMLISVPTGRQLFGDAFMNGTGWISFSGSQTYLSFRDKASADQLAGDLRNFIDRNLPENSVSYAAQSNFRLSMQPIDDIYLNPLTNFGSPEASETQPVLIGLIIFAVLILVCSCINYSNLSLAQISQRRKEIGIRKTLGATRSQIVSQFLFESLLLTIIALLLAAPIVMFAIPVYANLTSISIQLSDLLASSFVAVLALLVLAVGTISGILPALSLSRLQAVTIMKRTGTQSRLGRLSKATITALQFCFSSALILLAIAIYIQTMFLQNLDVGYNRNNLLILDSRYNGQEPDAFSYSGMINDLEQHPGVLSVAGSQVKPPSTGGINPWRLPSYGPDESITVAHVGVSEGFIETYQMQLLAGRTFSEEFATDFIPDEPVEDQIYGIVVTDVLARRFGFNTPEEALNQRLDIFNSKTYVIGVVKRFQFSSGMETEERSIGILRSARSPMRFLSIRIDPLQTESALSHINQVWERHRPGIPADLTFFSQTFNDIIEQRTNGLSIAALMASVITILIAGFGLFALASFSSLQRTKEIGIRKTLGASSRAIVMLLSWDFIKPVLISCILAWPLAYFAIDRFYGSFNAQATFSIAYYIIVALGVIGVALLTVAVQCIRAANADPVRSLRYE